MASAPRVGKRPAFPTTAERRYTVRLLARTLTVHRATMLALRAHIDDPPDPATKRADGRRADAVRDLGLVLRILEGVRAVFDGPFAPKPGDVAPIGRQVDLFATEALRRSLELPRVGIPAPSDRIAAWTRENVALIKTIDARYFDSVERVIVEAHRAGTSTREVTAAIRSRYGVAQSDAKRIATDQIAKLNGEITKDRQTAIGIREYQWSSSRDERVRPDHARLERTTHRWDDPPITNRRTEARNHPGGDIRCRCVAVPILPDVYATVPGFTAPRARDKA